ncbi:MAG: DUF4013 domain-containing protein [Chloroflexales bacterium]|nr:DUF4013 domain-containing protein [Chloroflexales bacterium]
MDFGKAFGYVFEDERWISKILIGGLVMCVPIVNFAGVGYALKVAQNVAQGNPRPLPEWNEFGGHFMRGLYDTVIRLVYALPVIIPIALVYCVAIGLAISSGSSRTDEGAAAAFGGVILCILPLAFILGLALSVLTFAALARYATTNSLSEAFRFRDVVATVRRNPGPWVVLLLVNIVTGIVGSLGFIALGIGVIFTSFYGMCVFGHAFGQTIAQQGGVQIQSPSPATYTPPTF